MRLVDAGQSCLLIVDVQEKLLPAVHEPETLVRHCAWLINVAGEVGVPVLMSEQYSKGLGRTVPELRSLVPDEAIMEKVHFSCGASPECRPRIDAADRRQLVVAGIEAHVCVLQSAVDLLESGKQVFVVADAVSSRNPRDAELALQRLRASGAQIVSREMVLFEWAHKAGTAQFKELSATYLR